MLVIAHRGASGHAPENTLAAFRKAVAMGATFIETDLQMSRDARLVAIHDATVNRTTNGQGTVRSIKIDRTIVNPEDVEMLEDLVLVAVTEVQKKAQDAAQAEMGKLTGGLNLPFKLPF